LHGLFQEKKDFWKRFTLNRSNFERVLPVFENVLVEKWSKLTLSSNKKAITFLQWPFSSHIFKLFGKLKATNKRICHVCFISLNVFSCNVLYFIAVDA